jgi:hypothetical protein
MPIYLQKDRTRVLEDECYLNKEDSGKGK